MLFRTKIAAFLIGLFSAFAVQAENSSFYTFSFEDDVNHEIQFNIPNGWQDIAVDADSFIDLKLKSETGGRQCLFWCGMFDEKIDQDFLEVISEEIRDELFNTEHSRNHQVMSTANQHWHSFEYGSASQPHFVGICILSVNHYALALVVENDKDVQTLMDDADMFFDNISLFTTHE